jgi:hypothetical protein
MKIYLAFAAAVSFIAAVSCQNKDDSVVKSVSVNPPSVSIPEGGTQTLEVKVLPETAVYDAIVWKSSDTKVVTVTQRGTLSGVSEGKATVTASVGGLLPFTRPWAATGFQFTPACLRLSKAPRMLSQMRLSAWTVMRLLIHVMSALNLIMMPQDLRTQATCATG